jgi:hypothetical protein
VTPKKLAAVTASVFGALAAVVGTLAQTGPGDWIADDPGMSKTTIVPVRNVGGSPDSPAPQGTGDGTPFTSDQAQDRLSAAAAEKVASTVGTENRANGSPPLKVSGETITLDDLSLKEFRRVTSSQVVHAAGTHRDFGRERTVWVATWERENVPNNKGVLLTVTAELVMEDGTGKIIGATITSFDPNASVE